jgi:peptidoglycan/LPS O-acetylase OafA/YrhL
MVLTTHVAFASGFVVTGGALGALAARMDFGVAIFFLLSGFLLYRPWARHALGRGEAPDLRRYALRRAARLVPAYWLALAVIFTWLPQAGSPDGTSWRANLSFTQIYVPGTLVEGFTQTWSVATEVAFYVVLPLFGWLGTRLWRRDPLRGHLALVTGMGLAGVWFVVARAREVVINPLAGFWLPGFLLWFALGMGVALVAEADRVGRLPRIVRLLRTLAADAGTCLAAGVLVIVVLATPLAGPYALEVGGWGSVVVKHVGYGLAALALLLPAFLGDPRGPQLRSNRFLASPPMLWLGRISYGIFLWHLGVMWMLINVVDLRPFTGGFLPLWLGTAGATCVVASASWHLLEAPILRWAHRR